MGYFLLSDNKTLAFADERMNNESVKKMWNSFTFTARQIFLEKGKENTFLIGDISLPELKKDKELAAKALGISRATLYRKLEKYKDYF